MKKTSMKREETSENSVSERYPTVVLEDENQVSCMGMKYSPYPAQTQIVVLARRCDNFRCCCYRLDTKIPGLFFQFLLHLDTFCITS